MLGMNDGQYQPFSQTIFDTYKNGYKHIIQSLQAHLPGIKIVLIEPTPWDDVTLKPGYPNNPQQLPRRLQRRAPALLPVCAEARRRTSFYGRRFQHPAGDTAGGG